MKRRDKAGDLRIWWIPQIPGEMFLWPVTSPGEAKTLLALLAQYDLFQYAVSVKPDFCNAGGLHVYEDGEWVDWYDADGHDIDYEESIEVAD